MKERLEIQGKCSVSEIKRQSQIQEQKEEPENQGIVLIKEPEDTATVPKFLEAKEEKSGALKGTAMHHVMQQLDFTAADTVRQVEAQLLELQKKKQINIFRLICISVEWNMQYCICYILVSIQNSCMISE